ncbi:endonuclease domain-containing protein [Microbacterium sp. VKM Ac-2923]|uniref:endonuclease domain-containing protein n=1 Tax=Microbacterium sp. VKM Ac-2923 TaxID=2929476 RepID=UPI001FB2FA35|nr:endonuclease domain-containing protein [Microbacterium sp. VKM Ac-2923]MCJ1709252.1 endonuclease VII domain-containing protein [Microbacterium sp. VKM Ac-2923]
MLCARRDRLGVATGALSCTVCSGAIHEDRRLDSTLCSIECRNVRDRARRYGVKAPDLHAALAAHDGCHICGALGATHIDHDHATGIVRGILCSTCNTGLGMLRDSPVILRAAANYIEERSRGEWMERINPQADAPPGLGKAA